MAPGEEARDTVYMLAFHDAEPHFANWQVNYRFGSRSGTAPEPQRSVAPPREPEPPRAPGPICEGREGESDCWKELPEPPGCHVWNKGFHPDYAVTWIGGCEDGLASGSGVLTWNLPEESRIEGRLLLRDGKQHGEWVERWAPEACCTRPARKGHMSTASGTGTGWSALITETSRKGPTLTASSTAAGCLVSSMATGM